MKELGVGPCGFEINEEGESDGGKSEQATEEWDTQIRGKRIKVGRGSSEVDRDVAWRNMKRVTSDEDQRGRVDYKRRPGDLRPGIK